MKATFENSVDVLVKAFMNDTLQMGSCHSCAVGNLVQDACGFKFKLHALGFVYWEDVSTNWWMAKGTGEHTDQSLAIGYSIEAIRSIEYAFEGWHKPEYRHLTHEEQKDIFCGLLRVVETLAEIHGVDLTVKENAIGQFQKVHATK